MIMDSHCESETSRVIAVSGQSVVIKIIKIRLEIKYIK